MIKKLFNKRYLKLLLSLLVLVLILVSTYYIDLFRFNSKLVKYDSDYLMKITYLIADRDKLEDGISIDDTIAYHEEDIIYNASQVVPLTKDGDTLYVDLSKFTNSKMLDHVTDAIYAKNNINGEDIEGCSYDKEKRILRVPFSYFENLDKDNPMPIQAEIESLLTRSEINNLKTNFSVKKLITYTDTAENELFQLNTKISLAQYVNGNIASDNVFVYVNGSNKALDKGSFSYDSSTETLTISMPAILINKVDIRLGNNIIKNVFADGYWASELDGYKLKSRPTALINRGTYNDYYTVALSHSEGVGSSQLIYCYGGNNTHPSCKEMSYGAVADDDYAGLSYEKTYLWDDSNQWYYSFWDSWSDDYAFPSQSHIIPYIVETSYAGMGEDGVRYLDFADDEPVKYILMECSHITEGSSPYSTDPVKVGIHIVSDGFHPDENYLVLEVHTYAKGRDYNGWGGQYGSSYFKVYWEEDQKCNLPATKTVSAFSNDGGTGTATVGLYSDSNCTSLIQSKTINVGLNNGASGSTTFNDLNLNTTYYVKETAFTDPNSNNLLTNRYKNISGCKGITTTDSNGDGVCDTGASMINEQKSYCYSIKKVDAENGGVAVANTSWQLRGADGTTKSATTNSSGIATFTGLKYQNYTLVETTANPADLDSNGTLDYWNDNGGNGTSVAASSLTLGSTCNSPVTKTDKKVYYCIKVKKTDYNTGNTLAGAEFTATKGNITINKNSNNYSSSNGITSFFIGDSSKAGNYTITETLAPSGYTIETATKTVAAISMSEYANEGAARTACLSDSATASDGSTIASKTYNSNSGNNNYVFKDKKQVINWYKTTENGTTLVNGAEFKVKNSSGQYITVSAPVSQTDASNVTRACYQYTGTNSTGTVMTSGTNGSTNISMTGQVCVSGLPSGTYTVVETKAPEYHTFGSSSTISVTVSNTFNNMTNSNKLVNYPTEFEFTKTVSSGDTTINGINWNSITSSELNNLSFNITNTNGTVLSFKQTSAGVYEYAGNNIDGASGTTVTDLKLGSNRKIKVYHLPSGDYYIKEKKVCCDTSCNSCSGSTPCSGYYYPGYTQESSYKFTISQCSSPSASSCSSYGTATKSLTNTPTEITFTKRDLYSYADPTQEVKFENEEEVNAFDRIKFRLKDENGNYVKLMKIGNNGTCKTDSSYAEYRYVDESLLTAEQRANLVTDLYTCGGHIKITHLCRGKKYTIEEYEVPANTVFTLPDAHITKDYLIPFTDNGKMCCDNNSSLTPTTTQVIDDTPTRIELDKKNNRTSTDIHEGSTKKQTATFEVYACTNLNTTCTKASSTGHKIKFGNARVYGSETVYPALLNQNGTGITSLNLTTEGNKGKLVLEYLPANYRYVVVETNAPDGYYNVSGTLAETQIEYIPKNTTTASANLKSIIDYPTMIKFTKSDLYKYYSKTDTDKLSSSNKIFDTMTFVLRDKDGHIVSLRKVTNGEYRFIQDDGTTSGNNVTELHPKNGEILITNIYRNEKYYIEETATDTLGNFILPTNIKKPSGIPSGWNWAGHPYVSYDLNTNLPNDTQNGTLPSESVTQLIENLPTRVVFEKRDKMTGELIDDTVSHDTSPTYDPYQSIRTTFNVYRCPKTVAHCRANSNGAELVYFENRGYITDSSNNDITSDITAVQAPVLAYKYSKLNSSTNAVTDLITDRGLLVLAYLPSEYSYSLYEKTAPNGYYQPVNNEAYTDFTVLGTTADADNNYVELTERVENTPTEIYFVKSDMYDYYNAEDLASNESNTLKIFDSMSFILRDRNGNILTLKCSSNGDFVRNKNTESKCDTGEYRYVPVDNNNVIQAMHTKNGNIKITHLHRGETYYIEEISNDKEGNFTLPDYLNVDLNYGDQLPFDNHGHPVVKYILSSTSPSDQASVTAEIKNIPTRVRFEKRDAKYNYLIPDETATFKVYQCDSNVECHPADYSTDEERLAAGIRVINFTTRSTITGDGEDDGVEVYKYNKLNANGVTELHPDKGVLVLRYLPSDSNYKYVLLETVAPVNYLLPNGRDAETEFTVVSTTTSVEEVNVPNSPTALVIRKYADKDGDGEADSDKLLGGAKFKIYKVTNYNANRKVKDQEKELLKVKTIKDGIYEDRPVKDTDIITTCTGNNCSYSLDSLGYISTPWESIDDLIEESGDNITAILKEGTAIVQYLEYDTYYVIEEVEAPVGYSLPEKDDNRFTLVHIRANETQIVDTEDALVNKPTSFTFYKFDEYNTPLDGATFYLQKLDNDKKYNTLTVSIEELSNGSLVYRADPNSELTDITTRGGQATVYYLEPGQYRILEVEAAEGYELPKKTVNVATFYVDNDGLVYGNNIITNKKPQETIEYLADSKAELIINIQTGKTVIKYGLIITALIGAIVGLMILLKKRK